MHLGLFAIRHVSVFAFLVASGERGVFFSIIVVNSFNSVQLSVLVVGFVKISQQSIFYVH